MTFSPSGGSMQMICFRVSTPSAASCEVSSNSDDVINTFASESARMRFTSGGGSRKMIGVAAAPIRHVAQ
jgi:hypothetical protein